MKQTALSKRRLFFLARVPGNDLRLTLSPAALIQAQRLNFAHVPGAVSR